jgi:hypothetical protein
MQSRREQLANFALWLSIGQQTRAGDIRRHLQVLQPCRLRAGAGDRGDQIGLVLLGAYVAISSMLDLLDSRSLLRDWELVCRLAIQTVRDLSH